jgi:hypothetical protein
LSAASRFCGSGCSNAAASRLTSSSATSTSRCRVARQRAHSDPACGSLRKLSRASCRSARMRRALACRVTAMYVVRRRGQHHPETKCDLPTGMGCQPSVAQSPKNRWLSTIGLLPTQPRIGLVADPASSSGREACAFTLWCLAGPCWRALRWRTRRANCSSARALRHPSRRLAQGQSTPILASVTQSKGTGCEQDRPPRSDLRRAFACEGATSCLGGKDSTPES